MTASAMRSMRTTLLAALALGACSSASKEGVSTAPEPASAGQTTAASPARAGRYPYTEADVQFMRDMIHHHAQALVMSGWAASHGASRSLQTLAERIINGQQDEIATMQRWLRDRGQAAPEPGDSGMMLHQHHPSTDAGQGHPSGGSGQAKLMPGMLTDAQMRELDQARGKDFDRLFLTYMIQHHKGALTMVNDLFSTPGAARDESVFKLASDVSADQSSEITRMERMLAETTSGNGP